MDNVDMIRTSETLYWPIAQPPAEHVSHFRDWSKYFRSGGACPLRVGIR
jgi:hypothetical protein